MQTAADGPAASAIDLAEMLVEQGMPFRQAHALIGGLVRESLERHVPLVELVAAHPDLGEAAVELLEPGVAVTRRRTPGGAGPGPVAEQSERFVRRREVDRTRLAQWRPHGVRRPDPSREQPVVWRRPLFGGEEGADMAGPHESAPWRLRAQTPSVR